jgi:glycosyltransferase involved in cell wall biosynthesis
VQPSDGVPFLSVIVPAFNSVTALEACLLHLSQQTWPAERFEIIIVDNGSAPDQDPAPLLARLPNARLLHEPQPGSYAARNRGIAAAKGPLIAFTDSDCLPAPDWLASGAAALLRSPHSGAVAGRVEVFFHDAANPTPVELYESLWYPLAQQQFVEHDHFGATANLFTTAAVLHRAGPFDANLKSSGDREWGARLRRLGLPVLYDPAPLVRHPTRRTFPELAARARRIIGGRFDLASREPAFLRRQARFFSLLARYSLAPLPMSFYTLLFERRLASFRHRLWVAAIMNAVCFLYVRELCRLKLGGASFRGD